MKTVFKYNRDEELVDEFPSQSAAAESINVDEASIRYAIRNSSLCGGFYWSNENIQYETKSRGKIFIFDLETSPIISYHFGVRKQFIQPDQIIRDWTILTYAGKFLGEDKIYSGTAKNQEDYDDFEICNELWRLFDEADLIIAHNCSRFDKKKANARFLAHGMTPPSPYKVVDTLQIARTNFGTTYHRLDFLSKYLGYEGKMDNEGFTLWKKCMEGDLNAWDTMLEYNIQDVTELENIYLELRPWDSRHPSMSVFNEDPSMSCTKCGSHKLEYVKDTYTNTKVFKLYQCEDCNGWSRSRVGENKSKALMTQ